MALLLDTHVLIWVPTGDPRVPRVVREALQNPDELLLVSAVTAFELTDLQLRGRIAMVENIDVIAGPMGFSVIDFPGEAWRILSSLPPIHRDPVDRMLVAHAMAIGATLVTADDANRRYPVKSLW